ncbi:MAG: PAS domain-containing protein [Bacteroidota bacterium]
MMECLDTEKDISLSITTSPEDKLGFRQGHITCTYLEKDQVALSVNLLTPVNKPPKEVSLQRQLLEYGEKEGKLCTWILDPLTGNTQFTSSYLSVHRIEEGEVSAKNATTYSIGRIHPEDEDRMEVFRSTSPAYFPVTADYRYLTGNNQYIWLEDTLCKELEDGSILGITKDIHDSRNIRYELKQTLQFRDKIMDTSPDILYIFDIINQRNIYANKSLFSELGYTEREVQELGNSLLTILVHPDDLEKVSHHHAHTLPGLQDGEIATLEYRMYSKLRETYVWLESLESIFEKDKNGRVSTVMGIARNINAKKLAEVALTESNKQLKQALYFQERILLTSPEIIFLYDLENSKTTFINQKVFRFLGFTEEEIAHREESLTRPCIHPEDIEKANRFYEEVLPKLAEGETANLIRRLIRKDGKVVWLSANYSVFESDSRGNTTKVIAVAVDVTKEKEEENKKIIANRELEQFIYSTSHDLRAPVRHILSYVYKVQEDEKDNLSHKGKDFLDRVTLAGRRLGKMIDELLAYSKSRNKKPEKCWIDSQRVVRQVLKAFKHSHPSQKVSWSLGELPACYADENMFIQLWENLISNALKYSSAREESKISITAEDNGHEIIYAIHDNGVGFNIQYADKLFSPFQRLHNEQEFPGNGIGLANADRIVKLHDGRIWAESTLGAGASFFFSLPKSKTISII